MTCEAIEPELVGFHFGVLSPQQRERVEAHLAQCGACLRAYLEVKRMLEATDEGGEGGETGREGAAEDRSRTSRTSRQTPDRPSPAARARLRRAVAAEVGAAPGPRVWWERPVAFAVAASLMLGAGITARKLTSGPGAAPYGAASLAEGK